MSELILLHDDNGLFSDYSLDASDYQRDDFNLNFIAIEDAIYIGLYKPFSSVYLELKTVAAADALLTIEKSTTAGFTAITNNEATKGFLRSGFINVNRNDEAWSESTIDGVEAFWIKITTAIDFTADIQGLNLVYADDEDLKYEVRGVTDFLAPNDISFISYHVSARDDILQRLRNGGYAKEAVNNSSVFLNGVGKNLKQLNKWDILDIGEIRQAAKYLCLSKIFFDTSENIDDKSYQRYIDYTAKYGDAFKLFYMSLDVNDDGRTNSEEQLASNEIELVKN